MAIRGLAISGRAVGIVTLMVTLSWPTQEFVYAAPVPGEGQTGRISSAPLKDHADYLAVYPVNRTAAGAGPRRLVQNETEYSFIRSDLITGDVGSRRERNYRVQWEAAEGRLSTIEFDRIVYHQAGRFGGDVRACSDVINGSASREVDPRIDLAFADREFKSMKFEMRHIPLGCRQGNGREWADIGATLWEGVDDMGSGQKGAVIIYKESRSIYQNAIYNLRSSNISTDNWRGGLFNLVDRYDEKIRSLRAGLLRVAEHQEEAKPDSDETAKSMTSANIVGPIAPFSSRCAISETADELNVKCPMIGSHDEPSPIGAARGDVSMGRGFSK